MDDLNGKVAVVTGAAGGIGLALCERLAAEGMRVVLADVDAGRLAAAAERLGSADVLAAPTDVGSWESVRALERAAVERFGAVHVLCNNAGVSLPAKRVWKVGLDDLDWMLRINLWGVVHGIKAFVPGMIERGEPAHVVNTASISGLLGFAAIGGYAASKFAIVGLSESLLHDLRARDAPVDVSVLCPGWTATGLGENSRRLRPEAGADGDMPADGALAPEQVADMVVAAIGERRFWILTHPGYADALERRQRTIVGGDEQIVAPDPFL
jgi:NAD(P)-dependent dehydrogenase (short-subunit alcohol dehydrogenase family)